jgi:hypothetical protein
MNAAVAVAVVSPLPVERELVARSRNTPSQDARKGDRDACHDARGAPASR